MKNSKEEIRKILNKCAQEKGYVDYEELTILHSDCSIATAIYENALTLTLEQGIKIGQEKAIKDVDKILENCIIGIDDKNYTGYQMEIISSAFGDIKTKLSKLKAQQKGA